VTRRGSPKPASAGFFVPSPAASESSDRTPAQWPTDEQGQIGPALVRVSRPDGSTFLLRVPGEHLDRVLDLAKGEFGDKTILGKA
jgi:hypothetical protein